MSPETKQRLRAFILIGGIVGALAIAVPASAAITGPCNGSVTIGGVTYGPDNDTASNPIVVPRSGVAEWQGTTGVVIKDHTGQVGVEIGPATIEVAGWSGANKKKDTEARGTYQLEDAFDKLPVDLVGLYKVTGFHRGTPAPGCEGNVMIKVEGNPLGTVPGAASVALTVLSGAGLVAAGIARGGKP